MRSTGISGLVHIQPTRRGRHAEPSADLGERFTFAQVDQYQQSLLARVERTPHRTDLPAVSADQAGHEREGLM